MQSLHLHQCSKRNLRFLFSCNRHHRRQQYRHHIWQRQPQHKQMCPQKLRLLQLKDHSQITNSKDRLLRSRNQHLQGHPLDLSLLHNRRSLYLKNKFLISASHSPKCRRQHKEWNPEPRSNFPGRHRWHKSKGKKSSSKVTQLVLRLLQSYTSPQ